MYPSVPYNRKIVVLEMYSLHSYNKIFYKTCLNIWIFEPVSITRHTPQMKERHQKNDITLKMLNYLRTTKLYILSALYRNTVHTFFSYISLSQLPFDIQQAKVPNPISRLLASHHLY